jgi:hypothetical protein
MRPWLALAALFLLATGCSGGSDTYRLYRTAIDGVTPVHVASFDAPGEPDGYNLGNCETVAALMASQPGVSVRYWCERR